MTRRASRLLAIAILLLVVVIAWHALLSPLIESDLRTRERVAAASNALAMFSTRTGRDEALLEAVQRIEGELNDGALIEAASAALAGSALQGLLETFSRDSGARLLSSRMLDNADVKGLQRIAVEARLKVSHAALLDLLEAIDGSTPYLFVEKLSVRRAAGSGWPSRVVEDELDLRIMVAAYRRRDIPAADT